MKPDLFRKRFFEGVTRYRWLETLGRGAVGIVFKAIDLDLDEVVALKVLSPEMDRDEEAILARFKREIQLNRRIKHPNVARIFDYGMSGEYPYISMEYVPGKDLWALIRQHGRLTTTDAISILRQIARGTHAVHKLGIVHRDLKSQNVIVDEKGAVAILDFGLARGKPNENFTLDSIMVGTPHYMSPEQASGFPVDARSDIYSIGIIAFEALTGQLPFTAASPIAVAMKQISDPLPDTLSKFPDIPPQLVAMVQRCLSKDPDKRFPSADVLETELAMLLPSPSGTGEEKRGKKLEVPQPIWTGIVKEDQFLDELEDALASLGGAPPTPFPIRIPVSSPEGRDEASTPDPEEVPLILVVNEDVRELIKMATTVCEGGCRTLEVRNGQEALEALLSNEVDAVLMDVELPGMDGFDTTRVIRAQARFGQVPILLVSGHPDRNHMAFAIQSGAADLLPKPLAPSELRARLWKVLSHLGFSPPERETTRTSPREPGVRTKRRR